MCVVTNRCRPALKSYLPIVTLFAGVVLLVGCGSTAPPSVFKPPSDAAPKTSGETLQYLAKLADPEVVKVSPGKRGNGPVYSVFGKSYRVMKSASGFRQEGLASWYGTKFHGRETSSGEPFDMFKLSAAHKHLPLPIFVHVTNLENGKQTIVRVNDRGPFHDNRILDLSFAAAVKLGFQNNGIARIRLEVVEPVARAKQYLVQAGAFSSLSGADRTIEELVTLTGLNGVVVKTPRDGLYRVRLGPISEGANLQRVQALLESSPYGRPQLFPVN